MQSRLPLNRRMSVERPFAGRRPVRTGSIWLVVGVTSADTVFELASGCHLASLESGFSGRVVSTLGVVAWLSSTSESAVLTLRTRNSGELERLFSSTRYLLRRTSTFLYAHGWEQEAVHRFAKASRISGYRRSCLFVIYHLPRSHPSRVLWA